MRSNGTTPNRAWPSTPGNGLISQAVLREFVALAAQARRMRELRVRLIALLETGAPVEPGPLTAELIRREVRRLTVKKLSDLIGADLVETFLANLERSETRRLDVREV